jgi:hypothetical protein
MRVAVMSDSFANAGLALRRKLMSRIDVMLQPKGKAVDQLGGHVRLQRI